VRLLEPEGQKRLAIAAAGDLAVIGAARRRAQGSSYDAVLTALAPAFQASDLGIVNLEAAVGERAWARPGVSPEFFHEPEIAPALARAGVRVASLANNHLMDLGPRGLARTLEACAAAGIVTVGAGADLAAAVAPARLTIAGRSVVILAAGAGADDTAGPGRPGIAPLDPARLAADVARERPHADVLVASVHWGSMYVDEPPARVLDLARVMEEGGVDLVLGHHPHVTQGYRRSGRTLTLFSLGDALLDGRAGGVSANVAAEVRRDSGVFTVTLAERHGLEIAPLVLDDDGVPEPAAPERAAAQRARLERLSAALASGAVGLSQDSASRLLRYEIESLGQYLRRGRFDQVARLVASLRPRHLPVIWQALTRFGRAA